LVTREERAFFLLHLIHFLVRKSFFARVEKGLIISLPNVRGFDGLRR